MASRSRTRWLGLRGTGAVLALWLALPAIAGAQQGPGRARTDPSARPPSARPGPVEAPRADPAPSSGDKGPVEPAREPSPGEPRPGPKAPAAGPRKLSSLEELVRLHAELAGGGRGLAPSPEAPLSPEAFRDADQDGDGLLSRDEFVIGYHRSLVLAGTTPPPDLAAEATRLHALQRARRAPSRTPVQPAAPVRTLIPARTQVPPAAPAPAGTAGSDRGDRSAPAGAAPAARRPAASRDEPKPAPSRPLERGASERERGSRPTKTGRP